MTTPTNSRSGASQPTPGDKREAARWDTSAFVSPCRCPGPSAGDLATVTAPGRDYISRGRSGDCCLLCGRTGVDLPVLHGCLPDLSPADLVRHESAVVSFMSFEVTR